MQDEKGLFYYPNPQNKRVRMYVMEEDGEIFFRLWNQDDPDLFDDHGWVPWGAIKKAMGLFAGKGFDPAKAYDLGVARMILKDAERR